MYLEKPGKKSLLVYTSVRMSHWLPFKSARFIWTNLKLRNRRVKLHILSLIAQSFEINHQVNSLSSLPFYNLDDDQFRLTLFEFTNGCSINFDPDRLSQLKFNPLSCESYKNFSLCKDNDPDVNFYLENCSCEYYYTEDGFNNLLAEQHQQNRVNLNCSCIESGLSLLHMNIRSITNKFDKLTNCFRSTSTEISYYRDF